MSHCTIRGMVDLAARCSTRASAGSLGAQLERDRFEYRLAQAKAALTILREHAAKHDRGARPLHIVQAIADFEAQIAAIRARLSEHGANSSIQVEQRRESDGNDRPAR
jgi:hypothetical protein